MTFDAAGLEVSPIRENDRYGGIRAAMQAHLAEARIHVQIDIGFGDVVMPPATCLNFPTLLADMPVPNVLAYPTETIVAGALAADAAEVFAFKLGVAARPRALDRTRECKARYTSTVPPVTRANMTVRRFGSNAEADRHDAAYWRGIAPHERVLFAWRLSVEQWELLGRKPDEPGLCRSVARLLRG